MCELWRIAARLLTDPHLVAGKVGVPTILFWEIGILQAHRRLDLPSHVREWREELLAACVIR